MPSRAFARCDVCTHAAIVRAGAACGLCGGKTSETAPPEDLYSGWRCRCYQCTWTPC